MLTGSGPFCPPFMVLHLLLGLPSFLVVLSELLVVLFGELMGRIMAWARAIARRSNSSFGIC